jgi:FtsP/CotA-like multicopper oxidase with cupredoxin domain
MCLTCLPLCGELTPTKTYAVRRWAWVRQSDPTALADGVLTITLRKSLKPGVKSEDDSYDVAEQQEAVRGWRRFYLVNHANAEVYEVTLGDRGDICTCDAGKFKVASGCKHRHAMRAVLADGGFDRDENPVPTFRRVLAVETIR